MKKNDFKQKIAVGLCTSLIFGLTGAMCTLGNTPPRTNTGINNKGFSTRMATPTGATEGWDLILDEDEGFLDEGDNSGILSTGSNALATISQLNRLAAKSYIFSSYTNFYGKAVPKDTSQEDAANKLPSVIEAYVYESDDPEQTRIKQNIAVTWEPAESYDASTPGGYEFKAVLPSNISYLSSDRPLKKTIHVYDGTGTVKIVFDKPVMDLEHTNFDIYADGTDCDVIERTGSGTDEDGNPYLTYEVANSPDINYSCTTRVYGYDWNDNVDFRYEGDGSGEQIVPISLTEKPSCTVKFNVTFDPADTDAVPNITVKDSSNELKPVSEEEPFQYKVQLIQEYNNEGANLLYTVTADGYAPVSGNYSLTLNDKDQTIEILITPTKAQSIASVRDQSWGVNGETELEISTPEQMAQYSYLVNKGEVDFSDKTVRLTNDIDLSGILWEPIGNYCSPGHFDGQGYSVKINILTLTQTRANAPTAGLFGLIANQTMQNAKCDPPVIENVTVEGSIRISTANKAYYAGGVTAYALNSYILNCRSEVDIDSAGTINPGSIGGVLGCAGGGIISDCQYDGTICTESNGVSNAGGIVGYAYQCPLKSCESSGLIETSKVNGSHVGGIAGKLGNGKPCIMTGCHSSMELPVDNSTTATGIGNFGGIVGTGLSASVIQNCFFDGSSPYEGNRPGNAICANSSGTVENCAHIKGSGADITGSTAITDSMSPAEIIAILNKDLDIPYWRWDNSLEKPVLITEPTMPVLQTDLPSELLLWDGMKLQLAIQAESEDGGTLSYQWYHNGSAISGADQTSYEVYPASKAESGTYYVEIINTNGRGEPSEAVESSVCTVHCFSFKTMTVSTGTYQGGWTREDIHFLLTDGMQEGLAGYEYLASSDTDTPAPDDSRWTACEGSGQNTVTEADEGTTYYWFRMRSVDAKRSDAEGPFPVQLDRTAPQTGSPVIPEDSITMDQANFTMDAADELSGFEAVYYLVLKETEAAPDLAAVKKGQRLAGHSAALIGLDPDTAYTMHASAADRAGNFSPVVSASFTTKKQADNTPPHHSGSGSGGGSGSSDASSSGKGTAALSDVTGGEWIADSLGWRFLKMDGSYAQNQWLACIWNSRADWYYFDSNGYMLTGWFTDADGRRYYLSNVSNAKGQMYVGWNWIDGSCYFFETERGKYLGHLYQNEVTPDGYTVNEDGKWTIDGIIQTK